MSKKKNKASRAAAASAAVNIPTVVTAWEEYMGRGELEDFQRLMRDLGFEEHFPSKTKCRQALKTVWVNIPDFLQAITKGRPVHHFPSERELSEYTLKTRKFYPKAYIPKESPLRQLLAHILGGRGRKKRNHNHNDVGAGLVATMGGLSLVG